MARITQQSSIHTTGVSYENEPIIKSDAASSDVMEWAASTGSSKVEIREDASNNLKLDIDGVPVVAGASGSDGQGLHFDGTVTGTYVDAGDSTILDGATKITLECIAETSTAATQVLIAKDWIARCFRLRFNSDGTLQFNVANGSTNATATSTGVYNDGKPRHICGVWDNAALSIYVNGNLDGTATLAGGAIPNTADWLSLGSLSDGGSNRGNWNVLNGTLYRARLWNKALSQAEVTDTYENATVNFADQWGSQTNKIAASVDQDWGTNQADSGNDTNDRATFNTNYVWTVNGTPTDISVASNVLTFTTASANHGIYYPSILTGGKKYRATIKTGTISGTFKLMQYDGSSLNDIGTLVASTTNIFEFTADATTNGNLLLYGQGAGTIQLSAGTVPNEVVEIGVVADYDLAFANPTQSLTVQDRAGAADGTASASGVTQVTPIEAVNTNKLNVGGTTPRLGVGLAAGTAPVRHIQVNDATEPDILLTRTAGATSGALGNLYFGNQDVDQYLCHIGAVQDGATDAGKLEFSTEATGGARATRMTIDSSGNVGVNVAPATNQKLQVNVASNVNLSVSHNSGAVRLNAVNNAAGANVPMELTASSYNFLSGKATFSNGIVETGGVLKSNLLTNSGLSVWSNGTIENVTGTELIPDNSFASDSGWTKQTGWTISGGNAVATNAAQGAQIYRTITGLTVGKLYKMSFTVNGFTDGSVNGYFAESGTVTTPKYTNTLTGTGTATVVGEATATSQFVSIYIQTANSDLTVSEITLKEVTPGCVAADFLAMDGWVKDTTLDIRRVHSDGGVKTQDGAFYSCECTPSAVNDFLYWPKGNYSNKEHYERFAGRSVTFGAWVKTDESSHAYLRIQSGATASSSYHTGGNTWEWLEVSQTVGASPGFFYIEFMLAKASGVAYLSQPMLVFGNAIGTGNYSAPPGEIVWCENEVSSNLLNNTTGHSDVSWTALNVEADSNGRIPKGAKAVAMQIRLNDSASSSGSEANVQLGAYADGNNRQWSADILGIADDKAQRRNGWIPCNSSGDPDYQIAASGSATLDIPLAHYYGVELR